MRFEDLTEQKPRTHPRSQSRNSWRSQKTLDIYPTRVLTDIWCSEKKKRHFSYFPRKEKMKQIIFLLSNKNTVRCVVKRVFIEHRVVKRVLAESRVVKRVFAESRVVKRVSRVVKRVSVESRVVKMVYRVVKRVYRVVKRVFLEIPLKNKKTQKLTKSH